jgi:hypothetical protein
MSHKCTQNWKQRKKKAKKCTVFHEIFIGLLLIKSTFFRNLLIPDYMVDRIKIHFIITLPLRLGLSSGPFPQGLSNKVLYIFLVSPIHDTCHAYLIFLDLTFVQ